MKKTLPNYAHHIVLLGILSAAACRPEKSALNEAPPKEVMVTSAESGDYADSLYYNGTIITMNEAQPSAAVVAVKAGRIFYVGERSDSKALVGPETQEHDLQGKTLLPGFVDPHGHVVAAGLQAASANLLSPPDGGVSNFSQLVETLNAWKVSSEGQKFIENTGWILGFGFDDSQLNEKVFPTAALLEQVSEEVPILLIHQSGHFGVMNQRGLELSKIDNCKLKIPGGIIRCVEGESRPNGILEENAFFGALGAFQAGINEAFQIELFREGMKSFARFGYTTAQEGRAFGATLATAVKLAKEEQLPLDVAVYADFTIRSEILEHEFCQGISYKKGLRLAGMKMSIDGSPQGKTAWLTHPYFRPPEGRQSDYAGYPAMSKELVLSQVNFAYKNDVQLLAHCNGDAAIDLYIEAIRAAVEQYGLKDRRTVLVHGQTLRSDQIPHLKELEIIPSLFPMHTFYWGDWHRESVLGPERAAYISPTRDVLDAGMIFTTHHDAPVALPDSMRVLSATVTRVTRSGFVLGPDQRVTVAEALKAMTVWPAYQYFEEKEKGSLEVGKQADFVILSENPLKVEPLTISEIRVLETINDGETVFQFEQ